MRVFVTGATGFIGSAVVKELIESGHEVVGLARSEASAKPLMALGARPHVGSIENLDTLRKGAAGADAAIHTAFFHQIAHMSLSTRLRVVLGGSPGGIVSRFTKAAVEADKHAIEILGNSLTGPDPALVIAFPTMALAAGRLGTEEEPSDPSSVGGARAASEVEAYALVSRGIRSCVVRLPPVVHDRNKQGLVTRMLQIARKHAVSAYVGEGLNRWAAVHRLDAARVFRLALENGSAGARYHAVAEEGLPIRPIAEAVGKRLNVPAISLPRDQATKLLSWLTPFIETDNPVSSHLTQQRLRWQPSHPGILSDLTSAEM
jgi:nucleoside-diphosphate-sugar epimerase